MVTNLVSIPGYEINEELYNGALGADANGFNTGCSSIGLFLAMYFLILHQIAYKIRPITAKLIINIILIFLFEKGGVYSSHVCYWSEDWRLTRSNVRRSNKSLFWSIQVCDVTKLLLIPIESVPPSLNNHIKPVRWTNTFSSTFIWWNYISRRSY